MRIVRLVCLSVFLCGVIPAAMGNGPAPHPIGLADIFSWKHIVISAITNDGQWFAYRVSPNEGDGEVIVRRIADGSETHVPSGQAQPGDVPRVMKFSEDSRWIAIGVGPTAKEVKRLQQEKNPIEYKLQLIELATGKKTEFDRIQRYAFNGAQGGWLVMQKYPSVVPGKEKDKSSVADLLFYELSTGALLSVGNVTEYALNKEGGWCAWLVDARDKTGSGIQLRNMRTGAVTALDSDMAEYKGLNWSDDGAALAAVKGVEDKAYEGKRYSVVAFKDFAAAHPEKVVYDPRNDPSFPPDMTISPNRKAEWTDNRDALLFGIQALKKKKVPPPAAAGAKGAPADEGDMPNVILWHWLDKRLPTQQVVEEAADRNFNFLAEYRLSSGKFYRITDGGMRKVTVAPKQRYAIAIDESPYQLQMYLDGRMYRDVYVVDLENGSRTLALKKARLIADPSPNGRDFLYYENGNFLTWDMSAGKSYNITAGVPSVFWNQESDLNVDKPPTHALGWTADGASVLIADGWDIWKIAAHGGAAVNLTKNGRQEHVRYNRVYQLDREEHKKGIDLSAAYFGGLDDRTKKQRIVRLDPNGAGATVLFNDDAQVSEIYKAKNAPVYVYDRESNKESSNYFVADASLSNARRLTDGNPQQKNVLWSSGFRLLDYTSAKGTKLQASLFLPANYEPGKKYPTIVYMYERLTQNLNLNSFPTAFNFNKEIFTSNGYAVLMPDIAYKVDDPGMSAVWCVLPALQAAIDTGVVDKDRVGLHGHSWGGYETAFLVTQTNAFRAAVAGAPITDLISMWGSIYGQLGISNGPIFESSQPRLSQPPWENLAAYVRNSPLLQAAKVQTPLLILDNDKDEAVDWNQGLEYFNALRRLHKPVVLLQYKGEGHMLRKEPNIKDYFVRMREFFDYYLKGAPEPAWLAEGVPYLDLKDRLEERRKEVKRQEQSTSGPPE